MPRPSPLPALAGAAAIALACAAPGVRAAEDDEAMARIRSMTAGAATGTALPVGVTVNGRAMADPALVLPTAAGLLVRRDDLARWGLVVPESPGTITIGADAFVALSAMPGLSARLEADGTILAIEAESTRFPRAHYGPVEAPVPRSRVVPAAFLDYDLSAMADDHGVSANAVLELGASGRWGVASTTVLADSGGRGVVRLETSWVRDFPDRRLRLIVGDTTTRPDSWGQPLHFAGVRLGTDFSLAPAELTYPLPRLSGSALVPSTLELVSRAGSESATIAPGLFTYDYRPRFTGAGEVTMTLRDIAGNARTITRSFYASTALLRPGLAETAFEAGFQRRDFALRSFAYGAPFIAAGGRIGLSRALTAGARAEAGSGTVAGGLSAVLVAEPVAELDVSAALSHSAFGTGALVRAQLRRDTPGWSAGVTMLHADAAFRQVGDARPGGAARSEFALTGSVTLGALGAVNGGLARIAEAGDITTIASASWSASLGLAFATLGVQALRHGGTTALSAFGSFTLPLGPRRHASLIGDSDRIAAQYELNAPSDSGIGYRMLAGYDRTVRGPWAEAAGALVGRAGRLDVQFARRGPSTGGRAELRGALVAAGGTVMAAPQLGYALALVDVLADTDVTVMVENRAVAARAGAGHKAIVTGLQPYAANRIAIDAGNLPLDQTANLADQTVAPGWRQMASVTFGTRPMRPARFRLADSAGAPLPAGLRVSQGHNRSISGQDGEIYLPDLADSSPLALAGPGFACTARLPDPLPADLLTTPLTLPCLPAEK